MERASGFRIELALAALIVALAVLSLMVGPAGLSPRAAIAGLILGRRPGRHHRARHPPAAHAARRPDRRDARAFGRGAAGPAAQSAGRAGAVRRAAGRRGGRRAGDRIRLRAGDVVRGAGRGHSRRDDLDRGPGRHRRPAREPDGDAARGPCARKLCRRRDRADPQSRAEPVHRARNRVLAARLAGGPLARSSDHRGAVHAGELDRARGECARVPRAHARRGCGGLARRRCRRARA